jgi:hypothetical protein
VNRAALCVGLLVLASCGGTGITIGPPDGGTGRDGTAGDRGPHDSFWLDPDVDNDGDGYSHNQGDCDDTNPNVHPGAREICNDGIDNDCNGYVDGQEPDKDGDGFGPCQGDCDDNDPAVHPGAQEIVDGKDNNCDGLTDEDLDGDGWTVAEGDCDDHDPDVHPGAVEVCGDGKDNDCNGYTDDQEPDKDGDGYGPCSGDCDDTNPAVHPGAAEIPGNGIDDNCDNLVDEDIDGDGWTVENGDCDDNDPTVNPGVYEVCGNGKDDDCDGTTDTDCLTPCQLAALNQSYLGCEFYAVDLPQFDLTKLYGIVVSNPSQTTAAHVTISSATATLATWTIAPGALQTYQDGTRAMNVGAVGVFNRAYRIVSDLPVAAYQFNSIDTVGAASTDASLLFAAHSLASRYYTMDYTSRVAGDGFIAVAATQAATTVTIYPAAGVTGATTATLNQYDVMVVTAAAANTSLTGSRVEASKPVAVFAGNRCTNVPYGMSYCDHVEEQIFPRQAIGKYYIVGKTHARAYCNPPDYLRVLADVDGTTVTFNPAVAGPWTLNAGQWRETTITQSVEITANNPLLVGQFLRSSNGSECQNEGDPSFILQVPAAQFRPDYVFLTPTTYDTDYFDIVAPLGATVRLDGALLTLSSTAIGASGHSLTSFVLSDGPHAILANQPVGIIVYGYGGPGTIHPSTQNVSYGYAGGLDLKPINPI